MNTYTTISGDTWDLIAFKVYGNELNAKELIEANPDYINVVVFSAGIVLKVPEISISEDSSLLPPWKQG